MCSGLAGKKARDKTPVFEGGCASEVFWSDVSVEVGNGDPQGSKDAMVIDELITMGAPENSWVGITTSFKNMARPLDYMTGNYINVCSMASEQEEMDAIVHQENYDVVAMTEIWYLSDMTGVPQLTANSPKGIGREEEGVFCLQHS